MASSTERPPPSTWESDKMLNVYIYDYCIKRNYKEAARAFFVEAQVQQDQQVPIDAREGFLYEWWTVFWDIFSARANKAGSSEAMAYVDIQQGRLQERSAQLLQLRKMQQAHHHQQVQQQQQQLQQISTANKDSNWQESLDSNRFEFTESPNGNNPSGALSHTLTFTVHMDTCNSSNSGRYPPQASPLPTAMTPAQRAVQTNPQLLSYCMSMHALGMGNRHIDSLLDSEKAQVTKDMQQRRNHGYPEYHGTPLINQIMQSVSYQSALQIQQQHNQQHMSRQYQQQQQLMQQRDQMQLQMQALQQQQRGSMVSFSTNLILQGSESVDNNDNIVNRARASLDSPLIAPNQSTPLINNVRESPLMNQNMPLNQRGWHTHPSFANMTPQQQQFVLQRQQQALRQAVMSGQIGGHPSQNVSPENHSDSFREMQSKALRKQQLMMLQAAQQQQQSQNTSGASPGGPQQQLQQSLKRKASQSVATDIAQDPNIQAAAQQLYQQQQHIRNVKAQAEVIASQARRLPSHPEATLTPAPSMDFTQSSDFINPNFSQSASGEAPQLQAGSFEDIEKFLSLTAANDANVVDWLQDDDEQPNREQESIASMIDDDLFDIKDPATHSSNLGMHQDDENGIEGEGKSDMNGGESHQAVMSPSDPASALLHLVDSLEGHSSKVTACAFDKDSRLLASAGNDRRLILWDVTFASSCGPVALKTLDKHATKNVTSIRFLNVMSILGVSDHQDRMAQAPRLLATCGYDKNVTITEISTIETEDGGMTIDSTETVASFGGHARSVTGVDFCPLALASTRPETPLEFLVASLDVEGDLFIWNAWTAETHLSIKLPFSGKSYDVSSNPLRFRPIHEETTDRFILATAFGKSLCCISAQVSMESSMTLKEKVTSVNTPHNKNISSLNWSKDGRWLITASEDMVAVWDASACSSQFGSSSSSSSNRDPFKLVSQIPSQNGKISSCAFLESDSEISTLSPVTSEPPRVIFGEYQAMHIWRISISSSPFSSSAPTRLCSMISCQEGVVSCIDACSDLESRSHGLLLASASGGSLNNLRLWKLLG